MLDAMNEFCTHVKCKVEASLMLNWDKKAKPVFGPDGQQLRLWTPDIMGWDPLNNKYEQLLKMKKTKAQDVPKAWKDYKAAFTAEDFIKWTPPGYRPLFEPGGKEFFGWQNLQSVPNPAIL